LTVIEYRCGLDCAGIGAGIGFREAKRTNLFATG
jgi:hypothetical protein